MIITDFVIVKIRKDNIDYYNSVLPFSVESKSSYLIEPKYLTKCSAIKVDVMCEKCKNIINRCYYRYKSLAIDNKYYCNSCKFERTKETNLKKYGYENATQSDVVKQKTRKTNIEKYGNACSLHNHVIDAKTKKTCMERYGYEHNSKSKKHCNMVSKIKIDKYIIKFNDTNTDNIIISHFQESNNYYILCKTCKYI